MKTIVICAAIACVLPVSVNAQNANISWQTPTPISGPSDVSTQGTYFASWAPYNQDSYNNGGSGLVVNGTKFRANSDLQGLSTVNFTDGYNAYNNPGTSDANYNDLMQTAAYNGHGDGSLMSFTWGGMAPGHTYLVQIWANDGRGNSRSETLTGGANTSATLVFGNNPGQYIIGTFVCDSTGTQTITMDGSASPNGSYPQMNIFQVRDITPTASIIWQTPVTISGTSDVSTQGTYFGSWAPYNGSANTLPVNGVTFQGFSDLPHFSTVDLDNGYNGFGAPGTSDANYNALLQYATFANETPSSFTWDGMTPGHTYLIQIWVNDGRNISQTRSETITGGTNTSGSILYGSDGSGPGQYIIGEFVAIAPGAETISINPFSSGPNPDAQINLVQVRDITPAQPRFTGISVSGTTLNLTAVNGANGGQYILHSSTNLSLPLNQWTPILTNNFDGSGNLNLSTNILNPAVPQQFFILSQ
jgi:hypothetical protein